MLLQVALMLLSAATTSDDLASRSFCVVLMRRVVQHDQGNWTKFSADTIATIKTQLVNSVNKMLFLDRHDDSYAPI